jgi:branched-chain amino acid transport system substrate-binding protein
LKKAYTSILFIIIAVVLVVGGCATPAKPAPAAPATPAAPAILEPYKIGAMLSFSAPAMALQSENDKKSSQLLIDYVNKAGGINGHPIEIVFYDDRMDAAAAVTGYTKLTKEDKVVAIKAGIVSRPVESLQPYLLVDSPGAVPTISISPVFVVTSGSYLYSSLATGEQGNGAIARVYSQKLGLKKIGLATDTTSSGDKSIAGLQDAAKQWGFQFSSERFDPNDVDFTAPLTKLMASGMEGMIIWTSGVQAVQCAKQAQQMGFTGPITISWSSYAYSSMKLFSQLNLDKFYVAGFGGCSPSLPAGSPQLPYINWLLKAWTAKYPNEKLDPSPSMADADALAMLLSALQAAGPDPKAMKAWMDTKVKGMLGTSCLYTFGEPNSPYKNANRNAEIDVVNMNKIDIAKQEFIVDPNSLYPTKERVKSVIPLWDTLIKLPIQ